MSELDEIWHEFVRGTPHEARDDFRFDPVFYRSIYSDLSGEQDLRNHYEIHGRFEGRITMLYQRTRAEMEDLDEKLMSLVSHEGLSKAMATGNPEAMALAFELIVLGDPIDKYVSDFSFEHYVKSYPDIAGGGIHPFVHYVKFGVNEGRRILADLRQNSRQGAIPYDPDKPTCLVCTHEFSGTGAPMVALQMARSAARTHNVVVAALRGGRLLPRFMRTCSFILWTEAPFNEFDTFNPAITDAISIAVLNSVECLPFQPLLVDRKIPYACYIHEFTEYTLPPYKNAVTALLADRIVFSSETVRNSWLSVFNDINFDVARDSEVIPQSSLKTGAIATADYTAAREHLSALIGEDLGERRVVYGAGHVQWRKGTDMFVMTAVQARALDPDTVFVWIGDGVNHEDISFGVWLDKHLREAGVNEPGGNLFVVPAGPYYHDVCRAADVLFLSSRLDPLPNVVFDAVEQGAGVLMFTGASGFDDERYKDFTMLERVNYGDLGQACEALLTFPRKVEKNGTVAVPPTHARMATDAGASGIKANAVFGAILSGLNRRLEEGHAEEDLRGRYDKVVAGRPAELEKVRRYGRLAVWRNRAEAEAALAASDNWVHARQRTSVYSQVVAHPPCDYAIHVHAYYPESLAADLLDYAAFRCARRVVVTTDTDEKASKIEGYGKAAGVPVDVKLIGNRGRDILPFIELFDEGEHGPDDLWCHVHLKKSLALGVNSPGDVWRDFLMRILFGNAEFLSNAIPIASQRNVGLVTAFDPNILGWTSSTRLLSRFERRLPGALPPHPILFPIGNMFWTKARVVGAMRTLFPAAYPWPNEPIANDGTEFHFIERLWPAMAALEELDAVYLEKADQKRA